MFSRSLARRARRARSAIGGAHGRAAGARGGRAPRRARGPARAAGRGAPRPRPPCQCDVCVRARQSIGALSSVERESASSTGLSTRTEILAFTRNSQAQTQLSHSQKELNYGSRECYRYRRDSTHCVPRRRARLRRLVFQPFSRRFGLLTAAPSARPGPRRRPCRACPPP